MVYINEPSGHMSHLISCVCLPTRKFTDTPGKNTSAFPIVVIFPKRLERSIKKAPASLDPDQAKTTDTGIWVIKACRENCAEHKTHSGKLNCECAGRFLDKVSNKV